LNKGTEGRERLSLSTRSDTLRFFLKLGWNWRSPLRRELADNAVYEPTSMALLLDRHLVEELDYRFLKPHAGVSEPLQ